MNDAPLAGIRVIDLGQYVPGPYTTRLLCDLGAEVIKIEPPGGDPLRHMFGGQAGSDSPVYRLLNHGKQIARLDLKDPESMRGLASLVAAADVMVESFRPGVVDRLGLGYDACRERNGGIVYCSLSGYGQDGPYRLVGGHDINYCAAAGLFSTSEPDVLPFPLVADHSGAMNALNGILAALVGRSRHGRGAYLDISLYEAILSWQYPATVAGNDPGDSGTVSMVTGGLACYNLYRTADRRLVTLGALEPSFWRNFCEALKHPTWIERQYDPMPQESLIAEVAEVIAGMNLDGLMERLNGVDCCFEPVAEMSALYTHPQTAERALFADDSFHFPGKINGENPSTSSSTRDLDPGILPSWSH